MMKLRRQWNWWMSVPAYGRHSAKTPAVPSHQTWNKRDVRAAKLYFNRKKAVNKSSAELGIVHLSACDLDLLTFDRKSNPM